MFNALCVSPLPGSRLQGAYQFSFPRVELRGCRSFRLNIYRNGRVVVSLASSENPYPLNAEGLPELLVDLGHIDCYLGLNLPKGFAAPEVATWMINFWQLGQDSLFELEGESFNVTTSEAFGSLQRVYLKEFKQDSRKALRVERDVKPLKTIAQIIDEVIA